MITAADPRFAKIPPRVVVKALALPGSQRREYVQVLIGEYDYKLRHLDRIAKRALANASAEWTAWRKGQRFHLEEVTVQLEALRDA